VELDSPARGLELGPKLALYAAGPVAVGVPGNTTGAVHHRCITRTPFDASPRDRGIRCNRMVKRIPASE
jgi:hypothetical protein